MKRALLLFSLILITSSNLRSQLAYYTKLHKADTVRRLLKESFYYNHKIYFFSKRTTPSSPGPILNVCDSNGVNIRTVDLPWSSFNIGNIEFRNGFFLYATQNSVYKLDTLGNVVWARYVQNNCAGGGTQVHSKFLKNGNVIVFGVSNALLTILRLNPLTGQILPNPVMISMNSANPGQVPNNAVNTWVNDCFELSNTSIYFLLYRSNNSWTYTENYIIKCNNDSTFFPVKGIALDNIVTNNFNTYRGTLNRLNLISNELVLTGDDSNSGMNLSALKIDTGLTVIPTRYPKRIMNVGATPVYMPSTRVYNNSIYFASTNATGGSEIALMKLDNNLNVLNWKGYNLDNQSVNLSYDCTMPMFANSGSQGNKLFSVVTFSNPSKFTRAVLKTDLNVNHLCSASLTPTVSTDSLNCSLITVFHAYSANATPTTVANPSTLTLVSDSLVCGDLITTGLKEQYVYSAAHIYPNPCKAKVTVGGIQISQLDVYNSLGQKVIAMVLNSDEVELDVSDLTSGIYFIQMRTLEGTEIKKLIKE